MAATPRINIRRVEAINVATNGDYVQESAFFFIRATTAGNIKYCPAGNSDAQAITKNFDASTMFVDPEQCRKIFQSGTTAAGIYVGFGT
jgi:hypothetical protein